MKRPALLTIEQAIARIEHASPKAKQRRDRSLIAVAQIEKRLPEGQDDLPHGEAMLAYSEAMAATGLRRNSIYNLWVTRMAWANAAPPEKRSRLLLEAMLTPPWGERERVCFVDSVKGLREFIVGLIFERKNFISNAQVAAVALARFNLSPKHGSAIRRWVRDFREQYRAEILIAVAPDSAKSSYLPAHGDLSAGLEPFEVVELDGSPTDILTRSGRRQLIIMRDRATRAMVGIIADCESAEATGRLLVKFFLRFGLPRVIVTDNGRAFLSERIRLFLLRLDVALEPKRRYSGEEKPYAESGVRVSNRFFQLLRGNIGHDTRDRQQLRGHLSMAARRGKSEPEILQVSLADAELEQYFDRFTASEAERTRGALGGKSTNLAIKDWADDGGRIRGVEDGRALWSLLDRAGTAVVGKRGLRFGGKVFVASELGALTGHRVEIRRHPDRAKLVVYTTDRVPRFLCVARSADSMDGAERQAEAIRARTEFRVVSRQVRAAARKLVKQVGNPAEILLSAREPSGEAKVISIPFATPALIEARKASLAIAAEAEEPPAPKMPDEEVARARYLTLNAKAPEILSERERQFLALFRYAHPTVDDEPVEEVAS